jgi:FlaA1/EpsC-like NDP-sugar epimerase
VTGGRAGQRIGYVWRFMNRGLPRSLVDALRLIPVLVVDAAIVLAGYAAALALRFDGDVPSESIETFARAAPLIAGAYIISNVLFRIYRTSWKYAGIYDALNLAISIGVVSMALFAVNAMQSPRHIPLTVNVVAPALILLAMGLVKFWPRLWASRNPFNGYDASVKNVLIVGAGHTGQLLAREFQQNPRWLYRPIGFVDDDRRLHGVRIHAVTVLGDRFDVPQIAQRRRVDLVALALPSVPGSVMREIVGICQSANLTVRTVPGLRDIVRTGAEATQLREVTVNDLLGREQADIDAEMCAASLRGRTVLITGAAGFIASELARQVLAFQPAEVHLLDVNETGVYDLLRDLEPEAGRTRLRISLCDIADRDQVDEAFRAARPDVVFHAAAYKHIPVMEDHPDAALRVNVVGTMNVCFAADAAGVGTFVFVSTDKAVNPDNVYGATKRIGELLVTAMAQESRTRFTAVRFGNVMGARGSVVPLFLRQIERGGPVLLTDPETTRYFMSAEEAVALVIQTGSFADQGQIFILDMGEKIRIADLAEKMIRLKGFEPGRDIKIVYTGLRSGDKLHEELVGSSEKLVATHHPKIFLTQGRAAVTRDELLAKVRELAGHAPRSREELAARLHALARIDRRDTGEAIAPGARDRTLEL